MSEKNRVSIEEARAIEASANSRMKPREWEKAVEMLLRVNGWTYFHDRDRPTEYAKRRKAGLPDFIAWKEVEPGRVLIAFIECKTGKGTTTGLQQAWIDAANQCRGAIGLVVYPPDRARLVKVLGGVEVVR